MSTELRDFFVAGGTLRTQAPSYVTRPADEELLRHLLAGEFCYILTARQMGKSSLMVRTAARLREQAISPVIIDLTSIGSVAMEEWYLGLLSRLRSALRLEVDVQKWWQTQSLSAAQRFTTFLRTCVLDQLSERLVVFIDEIDSTLSLPFRDDFFAAVRALYNARATDPAYERLTFAFLGVATPTELIQDRERTPFNIGQRIDLQEFTYADAQPLATGLAELFPGQGQSILQRILHWTNGHPYLTQKLCLAVANQVRERWDEAAIDQLVKQIFLSDEGRKDTNLTFIQDRILGSPLPERRALLGLYRRVYQGKTIADDDRSPVQNRLELYGLLKVKENVLHVRNEIYRHVFNDEWISANLPANPQTRIALLAVLVMLLIVGGSALYLKILSARDCAVYIKRFQETADSGVRISALASLLNQANGRCQQPARQLFYDLENAEHEMLFLNLSDPASATTELRTVVRGLSHTLDWDNSAARHDQRILEAMLATLQKAQVSKNDTLVQMLTHWLAGRKQERENNLAGAVAEYTLALAGDNDHPIIHFDRAQAYVRLTNYTGALQELEQVIRIANLAPPTPTPTAAPSPTSTATPASTALAPSLNLTTTQPLSIGGSVGLPTRPLTQTLPQTAPTPTTVVTTTAPVSTTQPYRTRFLDADGLKAAVRTLILDSPNLVALINTDQSYPNLAALALARDMVVTTFNQAASLRSGPSLYHAPGEEIAAQNKCSGLLRSGSEWVQVRCAADQVGWVAAQAISVQGDLNRLAEASLAPPATLFGSDYIFGLVDPGGEELMLAAGKPGWIVFIQEIGRDPADFSGVDYSPWSSRGLGVLVQIYHGFYPDGSLPPSEQIVAFGQRCGNFVANSSGAAIWAIGNEPNFAVERPNEEVITPALFAQAFTACRDAIHAVPGHQNDIVMPGAPAPWNNQTTYAGNERRDWVQYLADTLAAIGPDGLDGIALHTYTHGADVAFVTDELRMNPPFADRYFHFRAYQDFMAAIPSALRTLPVYILQTNQDEPWSTTNNGWVQAAYAEINRWNSQADNQKIRLLGLYRWNNTDRWGFANNNGVLADFRAALQNDYRWAAPPPPAPPTATPTITTTLALSTAETAQPNSLPRLTPVTPIPTQPVRTTPMVTVTVTATDLVVRLVQLGPDGTNPIVTNNLALQVEAYDPSVGTSDGDGIKQVEMKILDTTGQIVYQKLEVIPGYCAFGNDGPDCIVYSFAATDNQWPDSTTPLQAGPHRLVVDVLADDGRTAHQEYPFTIQRGAIVTPTPTTLPSIPQTPASQAANPPASQQANTPTFALGDLIIATDLLRVRQAPGFTNKPASDVRGEFAPRMALLVQAGPVVVDGVNWWQVGGIAQGGGQIVGWVAETVPSGQVMLAYAPKLPGTNIPDKTARTYLRLPFTGTYAIGQLYGENPQIYSQITFDGVPLKGNMKLDFATPLGTVIVAVDDGVVADSVLNDPTGFGNYIKIQHPWGDSFYTQLDSINVQTGQSVRAGDAIGRSGNSGFATGPYLGFAIRINPYVRTDGWGGYSDPLPYFAPEQLVLPPYIQAASAQ